MRHGQAAALTAIALLIAAFAATAVELAFGTWHDDPFPAVVIDKTFRVAPPRWSARLRVGLEIAEVDVPAAGWDRLERGRIVTYRRRTSAILGIENGAAVVVPTAPGE